ncbi:TPA: hypothetical protein N0F65_001146 [Lagenidium giganteum]|uniref:Tc1-like transposase DDE domain-containing protein n=1 Tax=Lagenidium giganteum TaxID=4803 RepID=A0AAV2YWB9_9STRA|nr:TPA: hypothetical protein N0F65_001146 [Lagenidium giganteum]
MGGDLGTKTLIIDNAPCHSRLGVVVANPEFSMVTLLRLAPYSCMLNPIENVFSAFKAHAKRYMRARQARLLATPQGETIRADRTRMLVEAANSCLPAFNHTVGFCYRAMHEEDMPMGMYAPTNILA